MINKKKIVSNEKIITIYGNPVRVRMYGTEGNQYQQFYDKNLKKWEYRHIRKAQKKYNIKNIKSILTPKGNFQIHHIDKNRENNDEENLILLHVKDHRELHNNKTLEIKKIKSDFRM